MAMPPASAMPRVGHGTLESCSLDANWFSNITNITTNDFPTAGSTSRSAPAVAPRRPTELLHNLLHYPEHEISDSPDH
jgi:hypothetical protein